MVTLFDFDHSGKGFLESDYMNAASGLKGEALECFKENTPVDSERLVLNEFLAILYALIVASGRDEIPGWAKGLPETIISADFTELMEKAISILEKRREQ